MKRQTHNLTKIFFLLFTVLSAILIGTGYGIVGKWLVDIIILLLIVLIYLAYKFNWKWGFNIFLISNSILSAVGILVGVPAFLMIAGVAATLASWELSNSENHFKEMTSHNQNGLYERNRMRLLVISVGSGMIVAEIALFIQFQFPFFVIFFLAIIILFCFFEISRLLDIFN